MTLREELEILRGEPIEVFTGDPMDIPCIETSDPDKLCKNPVVSVQMITYNHEPYIRQAIEGVMMQKTDFEFELIIGEDCSQDRTREICFEYQKKYPERIRVLWWHQNVSRLGGNGRRVRAHARGDFIALCEGDDYWIDEHKLQKQIEVMRANKNVGFCFCGSKIYFQGENRYDNWDEVEPSYVPGIQNKGWFFATFLLGLGQDHKGPDRTGFIMTATTIFRKDLYEKMCARYDIFNWRLRLGDATFWLAASALSDGYYIKDRVSVYRISPSGVFNNSSTSAGVRIDGIIVRIYFLVTCFQLDGSFFPCAQVFSLLCLMVTKTYRESGAQAVANYMRRLFRSKHVMAVKPLRRWYMLPFWLESMSGLHNRYTYALSHRFASLFLKSVKWDERLVRKYNRFV